MPYGVTPGTKPSGAISIAPGTDIQTLVSQAPTGATFWLEAGVHRLRSIVPKDGQVFIGAEGAVLNGARLLTGFTRDSAGNWVASGQTQEGLRVATDEADEFSGQMRGGYPDALYIDNVVQTPVDALAKVAPGKFFFDYAADRIHFGTDPTGKVVEAAVTARAFGGSASNVTVTDLTIEKYATPTQHAAIQGGQGWTIQDNEVRLNYGVGIDAMDNSKVIGNYVHDNGQMGIAGGGRNLLIEGNEIARNGFWSGIDVFWEGGGTKFTETDGLIVRGNYSHHNHGFGLWTDIDNINTLYENNTVVGNDGGGITHEISGAAIIRNNSLVGNGSHAQGDPTGTGGHGENWMWGAAIQLQNSKNVEVYGNRIDMTGAEGGNGIGMIQQDRGSGAIGTYTTTGNQVHDNIIVSRDGNGLSGGAADYNEAGMLNGGNLFDRNTYYMDGGDHWWWGDFPSGDTWSAYMKDTSQDDNSQLLAVALAPDTTGWSIPSGVAVPPPPPPPPVVNGPDINGNSRNNTLTGTALGERMYGKGGSDRMYGLGGADELHGGGGKDLLDGGVGDDVLFGDGGVDTFVFRPGYGTDRIMDFKISGSDQDLIQVAKAVFANFSAVFAAARDNGGDTWIDSGTDHLVIVGVRKSQLTAGDFIFV